MKVFISWSGRLSGDVATLLKEWLPLAVPHTDTFLSTEDIDKGAIWFGDIESVLKDTSVGVVCLTRENKERPWILFEAGGLNKGLNKSRVCPLLLDLDPKELDLPLKAFNAAKPDKENMRALCKTINKQNEGKVLPEPRLEEFFEKFWPDFESKFAGLLKRHGESTPPRPKETREMVEQILETVEATQRASQSKPSWLELVLEAIKLSRYQGFEGYGASMSPEYPPFIPRPSLAQLPTGLVPGSSLAAEAERKMAELQGKVVRPSMAQGQKPKPSAAEKPAKKPPAA